MKKITMFLFLLGLTVFIVSCDLKNTENTTTTNNTSSSTSSTSTEVTTTWSSSDNTTTNTVTVPSSTTYLTTESTTATTNTTVVLTTATTTVPTTYTTTSTTSSTTSATITTASTTTMATTTEITTNTNEPIIPVGYNLLQDELESVGIPATGDVKVLVFVVDFVDSQITDTTKVMNDVDLAFNGNSEDIDFESLHSYYGLSSYGKLNLTADIFGVYRASNNSSYYEQLNENFYATDPYTGEYLYNDAPHPDSDLIYELLEFYDNQIDYSDYDQNQDGFIDGVYVLYNHDISYESGSDLWWAYQYYYWYEDSFDGVSPNYYVWSGIDFFYEGYENVNARTIIHETGHMLGLDDYYDYYPDDLNNSGGLGTFMMDYTIGDHEPFSKILLGWITPIVIEQTMVVDLEKFLLNGEVLLIIDTWNNTIFDEYFLVMYYTPEGLNELDQDYIFTDSGILIFHVSAEIGNGYDSESYYYSIFNNNNTDTENKLVKIIEADMSGDIDKYAIVENSDLFVAGDGFGRNIYSTYRWYDNKAINLEINVIDINSEAARIEVKFK